MGYDYRYMFPEPLFNSLRERGIGPLLLIIGPSRVVVKYVHIYIFFIFVSRARRKEKKRKEKKRKEKKRKEKKGNRGSDVPEIGGQLGTGGFPSHGREIC